MVDFRPQPMIALDRRTEGGGERRRGRHDDPDRRVGVMNSHGYNVSEDDFFNVPAP